MSDARRIELLIGMAERLIAALEADIAALESGRPKELRTLDPEIQRLSAMYHREAMNVTAENARSAPTELSRKFFAITGRFRDVLGRHTRIVTRIRNASEGIVKAVAEEVERQRRTARPYAPPQRPVAREPGAVLYNKVV